MAQAARVNGATGLCIRYDRYVGSITTRGKKYFIFSFLRSDVEAKRGVESRPQHAMPPEFSGKGGVVCLNTRLPLPILLCAGYSVELIFYYYKRDWL